VPEVLLSDGLEMLFQDVALGIDQGQGVAAMKPVRPGFPSPSAFPFQTATRYSGVIPTARASRNPKLVPVFHAIVREEVLGSI
jgi:hypothetical protein